MRSEQFFGLRQDSNEITLSIILTATTIFARSWHTPNNATMTKIICRKLMAIHVHINPKKSKTSLSTTAIYQHSTATHQGILRIRKRKKLVSVVTVSRWPRSVGFGSVLGNKPRFRFCTVRFFWLALKLAQTYNDNAPARGALPFTTRCLPDEAPWVTGRTSITERKEEREKGEGESRRSRRPLTIVPAWTHCCRLRGKRQTSNDTCRYMHEVMLSVRHQADNAWHRPLSCI